MTKSVEKQKILNEIISDYLKAKKDNCEDLMDELEICFTDLLIDILKTPLAEEYKRHLYETFTYTEQEAKEFIEFYL